MVTLSPARCDTLLDVALRAGLRHLGCERTSCLTPDPSTRRDPGMNSRRQFLIQAPVALLGAAAACRAEEQKPGAGGTTSTTPTPGAPPAFNTAPPVGPEVSPTSFAEAEKLVQVQ